MRFSESVGRDVVSTGSATGVGRIESFVIDPAAHRITAVRLAKVSGDGNYVSWGELTAFGQDAVTVGSGDLLREPADERERRHADGDLDLDGKLLVSEAGNGLGHIRDVEFDPETGLITALITQRDQIKGERLMGIGSYAVVVARAPAGSGASAADATGD